MKNGICKKYRRKNGKTSDKRKIANDLANPVRNLHLRYAGDILCSI
jgi:hypothetical protein